MGKGEIARYEQFLLFPQCFQKTFTADMEKLGLVWERVNALAVCVGRPGLILFTSGQLSAYRRTVLTPTLTCD